MTVKGSPRVPAAMQATYDVNGFIIDIRTAPREVQELAYRKGLIPYIPADRKPD